MGKKGNNHLKSITCQVFLIFSTPSPSWGGELLFHPPRGPFQSPKVTKNTTNKTRACLAGPFMGKEGNSHMKSITCSVLLISPTSSPFWNGTLLIHHPRAPFQSPKVTKNAIKLTRSRFAGLFLGKEAWTLSPAQSSWVVLLGPCPGVVHHPYITTGAPNKAPKWPKMPAW